MDKYFKFIEEFAPTFRRTIDGKLEMFTTTIPTQHIRGDSAKELLDIGIKHQNNNISQPVECNKCFLEEINKKYRGE